MTLFRHHPTDTVIQASGLRAARYRRNHNFTELTQSSPDSPDSYEDGSDSPASAPHDLDTAPDSTVARGTITEILEWVDGDYARAHLALARELEGKNRSTLITALRKLT